MVQDVEELDPEPNIETSRVCFDVIILEYREIDVDQAWPDGGVPPVVAKWVHAGSRDRVAILIPSLNGSFG